MRQGRCDHQGHGTSFPPGQVGSSLGVLCGDMHGHVGTLVLAEQGDKPRALVPSSAVTTREPLHRPPHISLFGVLLCSTWLSTF